MSNSFLFVGETSIYLTNQPACTFLAWDLDVPSGGGALTFECPSWIVGRYVAIWKNDPNDFLTVCEILVSGYQISGKKILLFKP